MTGFRSRFLYPVYVLRIIFFLFGLTVLVFFTFLGFSDVINQPVGYQRYFVIALAVIVFLLVLVVGGKGVFEYR